MYVGILCLFTSRCSILLQYSCYIFRGCLLKQVVVEFIPMRKYYSSAYKIQEHIEFSFFNVFCGIHKIIIKTLISL